MDQCRHSTDIRGKVGRKWVRDTSWKRERESLFCPPGMTESLMQKDPTWREWGRSVCGEEHEETLGVLYSFTPPPSLKTHLSSFLCHTPSPSCIHSPSHSSKTDFCLFQSEDVSPCYCYCLPYFSNFLGFVLFGCLIFCF